MNSDKTYRTEIHRSFLIEALPEPLTRASSHLQLFDNYIHETRLRLRAVRVPETKEWTNLLQQRFAIEASPGAIKVSELNLNEAEYEHFKPFEGNEIRKNRYFHEYDGRIFEFDVYLGPLWGINRARVEFQSIDDMSELIVPPWATIEITGSKFFDDANLVNVKFEDVQRELEKAA